MALISKDLFRYVDKLFIDKNEQFEMGRVVVKNGVKTLVKPDHVTLVLSFNDIPVNRNKVKQETNVR